MPPQQRVLPLDEYEALPEDTRAEVFEDQIQYRASTSQIHQTILLALSSYLNSYVKSKERLCKVISAPFDVKLDDHLLLIVQPDIMIVCDKSKLDGKRCNGAPDFIIEIVSPNNSSDDYIKKLYYYKKYGVREYWIVDPNRRTVSVSYFEGDMISIPYAFSSTIKVNIYSDLYVDFKEIEQMLTL